MSKNNVSQAVVKSQVEYWQAEMALRENRDEETIVGRIHKMRSLLTRPEKKVDRSGRSIARNLKRDLSLLETEC